MELETTNTIYVVLTLVITIAIGFAGFVFGHRMGIRDANTRDVLVSADNKQFQLESPASEVSEAENAELEKQGFKKIANRFYLYIKEDNSK